MTRDLSTTYLGLELKNPFVPSASPLGGDIGTLKELETAGAAAVVLPSLFEEQITHDEQEMHRIGELWAGSFGEATGGFLPDLKNYNTGPWGYLNHVAEAKAVLSIPVIGSLNGESAGGWTRFAAMIEDAGADALELNIYHLATDPTETAADVERRYLELVELVVSTVSVPVAVKVGPFFSSMANMALRFEEAGAKGLVMFNRFYQPDLDIETLQVAPNLKLSSGVEARLPLRWTAIIRPHTSISLAASSGIHEPEDGIKLLLAGADVVQMASALLIQGPPYLRTMIDGLDSWMERNDYESVTQLKGSMSHANSPDPGAFERSNYTTVITSYRSSAE